MSGRKRNHYYRTLLRIICWPFSWRFLEEESTEDWWSRQW